MIIIVMLLTAIFIPITNDHSEAVCPGDTYGPVIQIAQPKQTASVAPGQDGIVEFTGTVFVQIPWTPEMEQLIVALEPRAGDWLVSSPPPLIFTRAIKQKSFIVKVLVPTGTSQSVMGQLEVGGKWKDLNSSTWVAIPPATAIIVVDQFSQVDLDSPKGYIRIEQGQGVKTHVKVHNYGNGKERIRAWIDNIQELEDRGWKIEYGPEKMEIEENGYSRFNLSLKSSEIIRTGLYQVKIAAIIAGSTCEDPFVYDHVLFIEVEEREILGIKMGTWIFFNWTLIILIGIVSAFIIITRKRLLRLVYSKLSRTRE